VTGVDYETLVSIAEMIKLKAIATGADKCHAKLYTIGDFKRRIAGQKTCRIGYY
jgi:hypothetical protein